MTGSARVRAVGAATLTFVTCVRGKDDVAAARLLLESLRAFGGDLGGRPVWVFAEPGMREAAETLSAPRLDVLPLRVPPALAGFPFATIVVACAEAEDRAASAASLVWIDPKCLVVRPPLLFHLADDVDVAVRPVHVRNVGSPAEAPVDDYWRRIYEDVGVDDVGLTVESFVDGQRLRAYFNSHAQAVRPSLGIFRRRCEHFERLATDRRFLAGACRDEVHRAFLFQALFSALVAALVVPARVRVLPPDYVYPYSLHADVPDQRRAAALDDLACVVVEGRSVRPDGVTDIAIREPLRSWLAARAPGPLG